LPLLPELAIQANDYQLVELAFKGMAIDQFAFTEADIEAYKTAFAKRGVATAALNYYRNVFQQNITPKNWGILTVPTLMIWGENDTALGKELTYGTQDYVENFQIQYISNCSHWVQQEQPELVNRFIHEFIDL
jgi:pimeloyl-ACP methyl ester carboxylesterase